MIVSLIGDSLSEAGSIVAAKPIGKKVSAKNRGALEIAGLRGDSSYVISGRVQKFRRR